jgi:aminoglycoside 2'-N-acetyltransferase I
MPASPPGTYHSLSCEALAHRSEAGFYARLGWDLWRGPLAIRRGEGVITTPDEQVMIMRLAGTSSLNLEVGLTAEWREGELW